MKAKLLKISIAVFTFLAFTSAVSACSTVSYQPELPEQLKEM
ncbi:cyclic lactone autoinducer peptide [Anaerophilus nitritogenes]|nr:cyclic lactone autoinducer peptide [Anaerophilus nitritogenes]